LKCFTLANEHTNFENLENTEIKTQSLAKIENEKELEELKLKIDDITRKIEETDIILEQQMKENQRILELKETEEMILGRIKGKKAEILRKKEEIKEIKSRINQDNISEIIENEKEINSIMKKKIREELEGLDNSGVLMEMIEKIQTNIKYQEDIINKLQFSYESDDNIEALIKDEQEKSYLLKQELKKVENQL
jgi:hypothetical protein